MTTVEDVVTGWHKMLEDYLVAGPIKSASRNQHMNRVAWDGITQTDDDAQYVLDAFVIECDEQSGNLKSVIIQDTLRFMVEVARRLRLRTDFEKAIVIDFINYVAMCYGVDYGLHAAHLPEIDHSMLHTGIPETRLEEGYTSVVLALRKPEFYIRSNTYLPAWTVVNTEYYSLHSDDYVGWIELEDILPPREVR